MDIASWPQTFQYCRYTWIYFTLSRSLFYHSVHFPFIFPFRVPMLRFYALFRWVFCFYFCLLVVGNDSFLLQCRLIWNVSNFLLAGICQRNKPQARKILRIEHLKQPVSYTRSTNRTFLCVNCVYELGFFVCVCVCLCRSPEHTLNCWPTGYISWNWDDVYKLW